jgi:hypothetical protein
VSVAPDGRSTPRVLLADAGPARPARSTALRAGLVLVVSAALAAAVATLTAGSGAPPHRAPLPVPEIRAVPAREAALFHILSASRRADDAFVPLRSGSGPLGANPTLARTVREPRGTLSSGLVSVVPARDAVCLRVPVAHVLAQWWCQPIAAAARGELLGAIRPSGRLRPSEQLIVGLVPDGVRSVLITDVNGARHTVTVRRNVYDAQIYAPQTVRIELPGHRVVRYAAP